MNLKKKQTNNVIFFSLSQIVMSTGIMVIVYLAAILFSIMFEIPYTNLSAKLLKSSPNRTKLPTRTNEPIVETKKSL